MIYSDINSKFMQFIENSPVYALPETSHDYPVLKIRIHHGVHVEIIIQKLQALAMTFKLAII